MVPRPARHDDDVRARHVFESGVGDEHEPDIGGLGTRRRGDELDVRAGEPGEDFIGADRVERGHVLV